MKRVKQLALAMATAAVLLTGVTAYAADPQPIEDRTDCKISLVYQDRNNDPIKDMRVRIYRVASVTGTTVEGAARGYDVEYQLTTAFQRFDENTGSIKVAGFSEEALNNALIIKDGETTAQRRARWQSIAQTLQYYATAYVAPTRVAYTDASGVASFSNLPAGLYLIVAEGLLVQEEDADYMYTYQPTFVALPQLANGVWDYGAEYVFNEKDPVLAPKFSYEEQQYEYEVYKRWVGDDGTARPSDVQIDIYRDGVYYETVYLNEANGWYYKWKGGRHTYYVVERSTGRNYAVTIAASKGNAVFTLTNTYTPPGDTPPGDTPPGDTPPGDTPPTEDPPVGGGDEADVLGARRRPTVADDPAVLGARRLPNTGLLWWPVPVMAIGGAALFLTGFATRTRSKK